MFLNLCLFINILLFSKPRLISDSESNDEGNDTDVTTKSNVSNSSERIDLTNMPLYLPLKPTFAVSKMDSIISIVSFKILLIQLKSYLLS